MGNSVPCAQRTAGFVGLAAAVAASSCCSDFPKFSSSRTASALLLRGATTRPEREPGTTGCTARVATAPVGLTRMIPSCIVDWLRLWTGNSSPKAEAGARSLRGLREPRAGTRAGANARGGEAGESWVERMRCNLIVSATTGRPRILTRARGENTRIRLHCNRILTRERSQRPYLRGAIHNATEVDAGANVTHYRLTVSPGEWLNDKQPNGARRVQLVSSVDTYDDTDWSNRLTEWCSHVR